MLVLTAGARPVGTVMATLLAKAGVEVIVLEAVEDCAQDRPNGSLALLDRQRRTDMLAIKQNDGRRRAWLMRQERFQSPEQAEAIQ